MVAAQVALEKLRHRDQTLKMENDMLKVHIARFWSYYFLLSSGSSIKISILDVVF